MMKHTLAIFPVLLFLGCGASMPTVEDARAAAQAARATQALACSKLAGGSEWHARCATATSVLRTAEEALKAAQAAEEAVKKSLASDAGQE